MVVWVRYTPEQGGEPYYWNLETGAAAWDQPLGVDVSWCATRAETGKLYYYNLKTKETTWDLPKEPVQRVVAPKTVNGQCPINIQSPLAQHAQQLRGKPYVKPPGNWIFNTFVAGSQSHSPYATARMEPQPTRTNPQASPAPAGASGGVWVAVETNKGDRYFWDARGLGGTCLLQLPTGQFATWSAHQTPDGIFFYTNIRTNEKTWSLPQAPVTTSCSWIEVGAVIRISGQQGAEFPKELERYNDQCGTVAYVSDSSARAVGVRLPDVFGDFIIEVPRENVWPPKEQTIIEFKDLTTEPALNGEVGTILETPMDESLKVHVKLRDDSVRVAKITKLKPRSRIWNLDLLGAQDWLQWRKEQPCIFIDDKGFHHTFHLHLPLGFSRKFAERGDKPVKPWPLLMYLHGTGGGSFFTHSKKALRSEGLNFAAQHFVVVSPACEWTWKDIPRRWVHDLFRHLRAASWIDPQRCYLTGCSMGGMGTWEVATCLSDVLAAAVPVAAHHQADRTDLLSTALRDLPILAVHSQNDGTCPFRAEEQLWADLLKKGSEKLHVCWAPEVDHCSMFERSYGDDASIFTWLLAHQLGEHGLDDDEPPSTPSLSRPTTTKRLDPAQQPFSPVSPAVASNNCFASCRSSFSANGIGASSRDGVPRASAQRFLTPENEANIVEV